MAATLYAAGIDKQAVFEAICEDIARGSLVKNACRRHGITRNTLNQWTKNDAGMRDAYERAREDQAHALAEQIVSIADQVVSTSEEAQRNRLRVDARKWLVSKIAPRYYGDDKHHTVDISVSGLHLTALQAAKAVPAQLTAGEEIVVEALPDDSTEGEGS